jgi:hypothetical protein
VAREVVRRLKAEQSVSNESPNSSSQRRARRWPP